MNLLKTYVDWAAQEQLTDPAKYALGISISSVSADGTAAIITGKVDVTMTQQRGGDAGTTFQLRGAGRQRRYAIDPTHPENDTILPAADQPAEGDLVLIRLDADDRRVQVFVGDAVQREVVESFTLECPGDVFTGFGRGRACLMALKRLEHRESAWVSIDDPQKQPAAAAQTAPEAATAPEETDFERLAGITAKIADALRGMGILTYDQLAQADLEDRGKALQSSGLIVVPGALLSWPAQATLAAAGRWEALRYLQNQAPMWSTPAQDDDLQKISGIGPVIAGRLTALGIASFEALSKADPGQLEEALRASGVRIAYGTAASWGEQAALAAAHDWPGLEALQKEIAGFHSRMQGSDDATA
ncbi:MAG: hypothetical protein IPK19_06185 [Chloroflexi bacterium]|nr:hypothetical protein [Chloroflexota bacterium]